MKKKYLVFALAALLVIGLPASKTLAYLQTKTTTVKNTFTYGDINITLTEPEGEKTDYEFKVMPGSDIAKDPTVTVLKDSEDCYLFVTVEKSANFDEFLTYEIAEGWTALEGEAGTYYREVSASTADQAFSVLKGDHVLVKTTVTKAMVEALTDETKPTLSFTAYAVQKANVDSVAAAWAIAKGN